MENKNDITTVENTEIIPVEHGELGLIVNSRLLHEKLKVGVDHSNWITDRLIAYKFISGLDFLTNFAKLLGDPPIIEYMVTLNVAKELARIENNKISREILKYFIVAENKYRCWTEFLFPILGTDVNLFDSRLGFNYFFLLDCLHRFNAIELRITKTDTKKPISEYPKEFWRGDDQTLFISKDSAVNIIIKCSFCSVKPIFEINIDKNGVIL